MENKNFNLKEEHIEEIKNKLLLVFQRIVPQVTDIVFDINFDCHKRPYIKVKTTTFQTTPALFKEVWIEGACYPISDSEKNALQMGYMFDYKWEGYNGGYNGVELGHMVLSVYCNEEYDSVVVKQPFTYSQIY